MRIEVTEFGKGVPKVIFAIAVVAFGAYAVFSIFAGMVANAIWVIGGDMDSEVYTPCLALLGWIGWALLIGVVTYFSFRVKRKENIREEIG